jgi:ribosomal protein L40E
MSTGPSRSSRGLRPRLVSPAVECGRGKCGTAFACLRYSGVSPRAFNATCQAKSTVKEIIVASFCSKCGAEIPPGAQACTACGAPQMAAAAYPVPAAAPPARQGSSALKIVLIIVAIFVGLGVLGAGAVSFMVWRAAHAIRMAANGEKLSLNVPGGSFSAGGGETFTSSDLGADIYPGASQLRDGSMRMTLPTGAMVSAGYVTSDSKDQVVAFYKSKFGANNVTAFDSADGSVITYAKSQQESVVVTVSSSPSQYDGKTQIHIVHTTANKSS